MISATTDLLRGKVKLSILRYVLDSPVSAFFANAVVSTERISVRCVGGEAVVQYSHYTHPVL